MSGSAAERVAEVTARARSFPARIYSIDSVIVVNAACTWPLSRSGMKLIRYGTCFQSRPAIALNSSPDTWDTLPVPAEQTATSEVLQVISSSRGELERVFETMLANATRIC